MNKIIADRYSFINDRIDFLFKNYLIYFRPLPTKYENNSSYTIKSLSGKVISEFLYLQSSNNELFVRSFIPQLYKEENSYGLSAATFHLLCHHHVEYFELDAPIVMLDTSYANYTAFYRRLHGFNFGADWVGNTSDHQTVYGLLPDISIDTSFIKLQN